MSLVVYLDGSKGKSKRFLTLAAVFADDSAWTKVRQAWECVLDKSGASYSHMRELLSPDGPFSGWDEIRKQDFVRNLFSSLTVADPSEFMASSLTIDLSEYGNLADGKRNVKPAEAICVDYCITDVFAHPRFRDGKAEVFFDRGEKFLRFLDRVWRRGKSKAVGWPARVSIVDSADMKNVSPLQIADLLAWSANRSYESCPGDFWQSNHVRAVFGLNHRHRFYGRQELLQHPSFLEWTKPVP